MYLELEESWQLEGLKGSRRACRVAGGSEFELPKLELENPWNEFFFDGENLS